MLSRAPPTLTERNGCPASGRSRNAVTSVSRSAQIWLTSDVEIPAVRPEGLDQAVGLVSRAGPRPSCRLLAGQLARPATWALSAGALLLFFRGSHAASGDGFEQPPVILLVLPGVGSSEVRDGVVEDFACAQVAGDHAGPPGPGVCSGECPATEPAVVVELERVHQGDAHAAFHVT